MAGQRVPQGFSFALFVDRKVDRTLNDYLSRRLRGFDSLLPHQVLEVVKWFKTAASPKGFSFSPLVVF